MYMVITILTYVYGYHYINICIWLSLYYHMYMVITILTYVYGYHYINATNELQCNKSLYCNSELVNHVLTSRHPIEYQKKYYRFDLVF
jgi:hypothetical protein